MATQDQHDEQEVDQEEPDEVTSQDNVLDMSDEEFMAKGGASAAPAPVNQEPTDEEKAAAEEAKAAAEAEAAKAQAQADADAAAAADSQGKGAKQPVAGEEGEGDEQEDPNKEEEKDPSKDDPAAKADDKTKDSKAEEKDPARKDAVTDEKAKEPATVDAATQLAELFKPFKANGRDIQVNDVEEARRLMQMGANYNKKMAGLKPSLAVLKMLENNGLNDPAKLSFLIDLDKKNPEAISKLIAESGLDPLDLSTDKAGAYKATDHRVNDAEVELDSVLEDLSGSAHYTQLLDLVGKEWDVKSRGIVAANPNVLRIIDAQMQSGIYDLVATEMARQRALGTLSGLSDLEAYRQVGDAMHSEGKFAHIGTKAGQPGTQGQQAPAAKIIVDPNPKKADDDKREQARRAAAPNKGTAPAVKKVDPNFNPLALSDEDFAKFKPNFK